MSISNQLPAMTGRRLLLLLLIAASVLAAYNLAVARLGQNAAPRVLMHRIDSEPQVDILFMGDSTMDSGLHAGAFTVAWTKQTHRPIHPLNISLRASTLVEQYLLLRHARAHHPEIKTVVLGFWDFKLTKPEPADWTNLAGNTAMGLYVEPELAASLYAPDSAVLGREFKIAGRVPMFTERLSVWARVEKWRRAAGQIGRPPEAVNEFGRVSDFQALAPGSIESFTRYCDEFVAAHGQLWAPVQSLLRECRAHGIRLAIVEMPMTPRHQTLYYSTESWRRYRDYLRRLIEDEGGVLVKAGDWVNDSSLFGDTRHLNRAGAIRFSERLADALNGL
jgi:hypothetical protein